MLARDPAADGKFFYSVATTGVYCRPSCAARTPRPENVAFHATMAEAERAGFRPCRRCQPDQPPLAERQTALVADLCRLIENAERAPSLQELADHAGLSTYHLHRVFRTVTGLTPREYASARRAGRVRAELASSATVTEAIYGAGYNTGSRFYEQSNRLLGMTLTRYRAGGAGMEIRFAVGECSLGSILVAASEQGICAILLGDDPDVLVRDLQDRFPRADLIGGDAGFEQLVAQVVGFVEAPGRGLDLPLDVRGTVFQQRVWAACRKFPPAPRPATAKSPGASARRRRSVPSPAPVLPMRWRWRFPVIAWCATTADWRAIAGASSASAPCSSARRRARTGFCRTAVPSAVGREFWPAASRGRIRRGWSAAHR